MHSANSRAGGTVVWAVVIPHWLRSLVHSIFDGASLYLCTSNSQLPVCLKLHNIDDRVSNNYLHMISMYMGNESNPTQHSYKIMKAQIHQLPRMICHHSANGTLQTLSHKGPHNIYREISSTTCTVRTTSPAYPLFGPRSTRTS